MSLRAPSTFESAVRASASSSTIRTRAVPQLDSASFSGMCVTFLSDGIGCGCGLRLGLGQTVGEREQAAGEQKRIEEIVEAVVDAAGCGEQDRGVNTHHVKQSGNAEGGSRFARAEIRDDAEAGD